MFKFIYAFFLTLTLAIAGGSQPQTVSTDTSSIAFHLKEAHFPLEKIGSFTNKKLLTCNGLSGTFEYREKSLIFYPEKDLQSSTKYICTLNKEYFDFSVAPFVFTTEEFKVIDARLFAGGTLRIEFNDKVNLKDFKESFQIKKENKFAQTELLYSVKASQDSKSFLIHINENISQSKISLKVDKFLLTSLGRSIRKSYTQTFKADTISYVDDKTRHSMTLYDFPRFQALDDGRLAIRLYFEGSFYNNGSIKKFIKIKDIKYFTVSDSRYIYSHERKKYHLSKKSNYYVDIIADFESQKNYEIILKEGLKDNYEFQLREDKSFTITMGDREAALKFESTKPYLSTLGEVGFESTNIEKITLVVEKLLDQNYRYFLNFDLADTGSIEYLGKEVLSQSFTLDGEKNRFSKHKISLKPFMANFDSGVYRMVIHYGKDKQTSKAIYFSDLGIMAKVSNNQLFVSVSRLSTTDAVAGAKVLLYSAKNELIASGKTEADGIYIFEQKNLAQQIPSSVVVNYKKEQNFLVLDGALNGVGFPYEERLYDKYKAFIYFQSELIRPEGKLSCLINFKDKDFSSAVKMPLKVTISDPSYREIYSKAYTTNEIGALTFTLPMLKEYKTGKYRLNVHFAGRVLASKSFRVEAFMPQKLKNKIVFKKDSFTLGELMKAKLSSRYLFGAPSSGLKAEVRLNALAKNYTNKRYKNYSFNNESLRDTNKLNYFDISRQLLLDDKGEVEVALPLHVKQKVPSMLEAQMAFTVFDDGRGVSTYKRIDLYAYKYMVGVHIANQSIDKTQTAEVDTLLLDPLTQELASSPLDVLIKRFRWHYVYDANGYYRWSKEYETIENFTVSAGEHFSRKFESSGDYVIEVYDRLSGHSSSQNFSVRGWDYNPISPTNDMGKVQVAFENRPYKKAEILKLSITAPILKGRLLVSLEGEKVLWHKVIYIKKGSARLDIPLNFDFKDGLYLHTSIVRSTDTPSTLIPFRARSSHFIKPNREMHHSKITMTIPKITRSNRDITLEVHSEKDAYILVSVVDEGILQITQQEPPKPFEFFTRKADEKVAYFDLYDKVMHYLTQGKMLNFGGDSARELKKAQKHKAPDTGAKRVKPFLFWSGLIKIDKSGYTKVKLPIPAFNGQAKIVVLSLSHDSIGALSTDLIVRDDIIIKPTYPRFSLVGDTLSIPVRIFNTTSEEINARLSAQTSQELRLKELPKKITIAPKSSKLYTVQLHALAFGKGEVKITAETSNASYFHKVELPVIYADALQTYIQRGELKTSKSFEIPRQYLTKQTPANITVDISNNFLSQLKGDVNYLVGYPYGCAEQISSKLFAMLYIEDFLEDKSSDESKNILKDRESFIQSGIEKLANMQQQSGEFSYWNRGGYVNAYSSIYASDLILHVKEAGYSVSDTLIANTFKGLQRMAQGGGHYKYGNVSNFERMYASYLLSQSKKLDISLINTLYDKKIYLQHLASHYMMAAILKNAKMYKEMSQILDIIESYDLSKIHDRKVLGYDFYSRSRELALSLYLHVKNFEKNPTSQALLEATQKTASSLYSSQEKAMVMRALATYYKGETDNTVDVTLKIDGVKEHYKKSFHLESQLYKPTLAVDSKNLINYNIEVSQYLPREVKHHSVLKNTKTLNIRRSYVNDKGAKVDLNNLALGDLIYSKVEIQSPEKLENIVISDRISSCFEIINERVHAHRRTQKVRNSSSFRADYQDIRDDRILSFLSLSGNAMTYFTPLRVTTAGECKLPAITTEAMYDSRISDYDKEVDSFFVKRAHPSVAKTESNKLKQKW